MTFLRQILNNRLRFFSSQVFVHRDTPTNNPTTPSFAFTPSNNLAAQEILSRYPPQYKKAAVIPLLHLAQEQLGWTSLSVMNYVADYLEIPRMRVYEVATFYTMFQRKPVGKYLIQICTTTPCMLCESQSIVDALISELGINAIGDTTDDKLFTLQEVECAGACVNAPMLLINYEYYEDLTPDLARQLIKDLRAGKEIKPGPQGQKRLSCEPFGVPNMLAEYENKPNYTIRPDL